MTGRCWTFEIAVPKGADKTLRHSTMTASEQMFFLGAPLAHVVQYEEQLREERAQRAGGERHMRNASRFMARLGERAARGAMPGLAS